MIEKDKFIYGCIDVEILDHEKLYAAGAAAFGVYVAAICYCRKKLNDGVMTKAAAFALIGGEGEQHFGKLIEVGWFIERDGGKVEVWNYAKKNQTKADVEAAREALRGRMAKHRAAKREAGAALVTGDVTRDTHVTDTVTNTVCAPFVLNSSSNSFSDQKSGSETRERPTVWPADPYFGATSPVERAHRLATYQAAARKISPEWSFPTAYRDRELDALDAVYANLQRLHPQFVAAAIDGLVARDAEAFVAWLKTFAKPAIYGNGVPSGMQRWLNADRGKGERTNDPSRTGPASFARQTAMSSNVVIPKPKRYAVHLPPLDDDAGGANAAPDGAVVQ